MHDIEESTKVTLDFHKLGKIAATGAAVLPVVVQDSKTREVLLIAYVTEEALQLSLSEKRAIFYSTSRGEIWRKGETSGDIFLLDEVRVNCEQNSLLFLVTKGGIEKGACHTVDEAGKHRPTCYYRKLTGMDTLSF